MFVFATLTRHGRHDQQVQALARTQGGLSVPFQKQLQPHLLGAFESERSQLVKDATDCATALAAEFGSSLSQLFGEAFLLKMITLCSRANSILSNHTMIALISIASNCPVPSGMLSACYRTVGKGGSCVKQENSREAVCRLLNIAITSWPEASFRKLIPHDVPNGQLCQLLLAGIQDPKDTLRRLSRQNYRMFEARVPGAREKRPNDHGFVKSFVSVDDGLEAQKDLELITSLENGALAVGMPCFWAGYTEASNLIFDETTGTARPADEAAAGGGDAEDGMIAAGDASDGVVDAVGDVLAGADHGNDDADGDYDDNDHSMDFKDLGPPRPGPSVASSTTASFSSSSGTGGNGADAAATTTAASAPSSRRGSAHASSGGGAAASAGSAATVTSTKAAAPFSSNSSNSTNSTSAAYPIASDEPIGHTLLSLAGHAKGFLHLTMKGINGMLPALAQLDKRWQEAQKRAALAGTGAGASASSNPQDVMSAADAALASSRSARGDTGGSSSTNSGAGTQAKPSTALFEALPGAVADGATPDEVESLADQTLALLDAIKRLLPELEAHAVAAKGHAAAAAAARVG